GSCRWSCKPAPTPPHVHLSMPPAAPKLSRRTIPIPSAEPRDPQTKGTERRGVPPPAHHRDIRGFCSHASVRGLVWRRLRSICFSVAPIVLARRKDSKVLPPRRPRRGALERCPFPAGR